MNIAKLCLLLLSQTAAFVSADGSCGTVENPLKWMYDPDACTREGPFLIGEPSVRPTTFYHTHGNSDYVLFNAGTGPGSPTQTRVNVQGLYHYYYSARCDGTVYIPRHYRLCGRNEVLCYNNVVTNGKHGPGPVTAGYNTDDARYYCPEAGTYKVDFIVVGDATVSIVDTNDTALATGNSTIQALWFCRPGDNVSVRLRRGKLRETGPSEWFSSFIVYRIA